MQRRTRARSEDVDIPASNPQPVKKKHIRLVIAGLIALTLAVPAGAVVSRPGQPTRPIENAAAQAGSGQSWRAHADSRHSWKTHSVSRSASRSQPGMGPSGKVTPAKPTPAASTPPDPTPTDPPATDPTPTDPPTTDPPSTNPGDGGQILIGALGDAAGLSSEISHPLAEHRYADFGQEVPDNEMVTASSSMTWSQVAAMQPGSQLYQDVVRWATVLKNRPGTPLFSYSHEPEQGSRMGLGDAGDFVRAFRKVVTVMRAHGATNVLYTWQMTGWAFKASPNSREAAAHWYPGDAYVDVVGPDEYNWSTCGEGSGEWISLGDLVSPALTFAADHGTRLALPEFASFTDGRRAAWIRSAQDYLESNKGRIVAAFYFNRGPTNPANMDCKWALNQDREYNAFGQMVRDANFKS
ncbi:MAG: glycosyl hydrolase [Nocardioidaceae bacterium]